MPLRPARWCALLPVLCAAQFAAAQGGAPAAAPPARGPVTIDAERIEGVSDLEVTARGRVELRRDDFSVFSDFLRYNREFGRIEADGGVRLQSGPDRFTGTRLRYDTRDDTGVFEDLSFILQRGQTARGSAARLEFAGRNRLRLERAAYTTCEPGRDDWRIEAGQLDLDYESAEGRARDLRLRFLGTTLLAVPAASFPLDRQRKSGFLTPWYNQSTRRGLELNVPYYWNIAPEQDLTLTPGYMTRRGEMLRTQYRYLGRDYGGELRWEHVPNDRELHRPRSGFSLLHDQRILPNLTGRLDLNKVTDDRYFVDFASNVRTYSIGNLQREGVLSYAEASGPVPHYLEARVQRFQTLQDQDFPIPVPYDRLPQVRFGATRNDIAGRFDLNFPGEYVRFAHVSAVEGTRFSLNPTLEMPLRGAGYFAVPKLGARLAHYDLTRTAAGQPARQSVTLPWFSADAGLIFEREARLFGEALTQTLEPRFFYVYVPFRAQDQIPLFDTTLSDFNYTSLFTENRFAGGDRFGDANQYTLALTSRFLGAGGQELFRATVGQRYYFKNDRVALDAATPLRSADSSDVLASVGGRLLRDWTFDATVQYGVRDEQTQQYGVQLRYSPEIAKVVNASYRFNRDLLRQVDLWAQWPVATGWYAVGRYNYSLRDKQLLEGLGGFEYNGGCWVFRAVAARRQVALQTTSTDLMFQLELNGLGQIGHGDIVSVLQRAIPAYRPTNPSDPALVPPGARPLLPFPQVY